MAAQTVEITKAVAIYVAKGVARTPRAVLELAVLTRCAGYNGL